MRRRTALAVLALALGARIASAQSFGSPGPPALKDQFGKSDSLAAHQGRPVAVIVVDGDHLRELKAFDTLLREGFDGLDVIRVVEIPQKPGIRPEGVARKLRAKVPQDVPVLIDEDNVWSSVYGFESREGNILLFDRELRLVTRFEARATPEVIERISKEIETSLGLTRKPAPAPAQR